MRHRFSRICLSFFLLLPSFSFCQQLHTRQLSLKDDFEAQKLEIRTCLQGKEGFMWLATQYGLMRYDSHRLLPLRANEQETAASVLYQAPDSSLWVGYDNGRIGIVPPGRQQLQLYPDSLRLPIRAFATDRFQRTWVATYGDGLYCLQPDTLIHINTAQGLPDDFVYALVADQQGNLWAGTDRGLGIISFADDRNIRLGRLSNQQGLPDNIVRSLALDKQGQLWVGMESQGFCRIDPASRRIRWRMQKPWPYGSVHGLQTYQQQLWVQTASQGALLFSLQPAVQFISQVSADKPLNALTVSQQGKAWLASPDALIVADPSLRYWPLPEDIRQLYALLPDSAACWLATDRGLLQYSFADQKVKPLFQTRNKEPISSLYQDSRKALWCASLGDGLYRISSMGLSQYTEADGLPNNNVLAVHGRAGDSIWVSTLGGIGIFSAGQERFLNYSAAYPTTNYVYDVHAAEDGRVWFATDGEGAGYWQAGHAQALTDSLPSRNVYAIGEGANSLLLLPAEGGLLRWQQDSLHYINRQNGLRSNTLLAAALNKEQMLLAVHKEGIDLATADLASWNYYFTENQLPFTEIYPNALQADAAGHFWLGMPGRLLQFIPPPQGLKPLTTRITEIQQLFQAVSAGTTSFAPDNNHLSFRYAALQFPASELTQYQVFLEGFDAGWQPTRNTQAIYPNLPPGTYTFRVRAALNGTFRPGMPEARYSFTILTPWWQQSWFLLTALAATLGLAFGIVRMREKQLKEEARRRQERIQLELQTLRSQINPHFLFNSFNTLITEIEVSGREAAPFAEALSDFFRHVLGYQDKNLIPLSEEIALSQNYLYLQQKRYGAGLHYTQELPEGPLPYAIPPLSLQQLLENALKHNMATANRPLHIRLSLRESYLCLENNRQPRRQPIRSTGTGLRNIQRRYRLLTQQDIRISETTESFMVCLPLLPYA